LQRGCAVIARAGATWTSASSSTTESRPRTAQRQWGRPQETCASNPRPRRGRGPRSSQRTRQRAASLCLARAHRRLANGEFLVLAVGEDAIFALLEQRVERQLLQMAQRLGERFFSVTIIAA
jgi:hypothetical protein